MKLKEAAERAGVKPETLRRWAKSGVIPELDGGSNGEWTPAAAAHARIVARLRERGHTLDQIREATEEGRLAYGFVEDLFPREGEERTLEEIGMLLGVTRERIRQIRNRAFEKLRESPDGHALEGFWALS